MVWCNGFLKGPPVLILLLVKKHEPENGPNALWRRVSQYKVVFGAVLTYLDLELY
jgi:hypothetical protein